MPKKKEMMMSCCTMHRTKGVGMLILGLLILLNVYWPYLSWGAFVGIAIAIIGFIKLVMPHGYHM